MIVHLLLGRLGFPHPSFIGNADAECNPARHFFSLVIHGPINDTQTFFEKLDFSLKILSDHRVDMYIFSQRSEKKNPIDAFVYFIPPVKK
jgi:hypothetical protein